MCANIKGLYSPNVWKVIYMLDFTLMKRELRGHTSWYYKLLANENLFMLSVNSLDRRFEKVGELSGIYHQYCG